MGDVNTQVAEPSPAATAEVPTNPQDYAEWRISGKLPASKTEAPTTSKESAAGEEHAEKAAPAPEAGNHQQDKTKPRSNAESRLNELLSDLRQAGLTPAELKTFKREAKQESAQQPPAAPEKTEQPAGLEPPKKPKAEDFETWEKFEAAKDQYIEDVTNYKSRKAIEDYRAQEAQNSAQRELDGKVKDAQKRYGEDAAGTIGTTAQTIWNDQQIPQGVKALLSDSPVLVDLLYVMGSKAEDLAEFQNLARTNPGAAVRKMVLLEHLVQEELAKGGSSSKAGSAESSETPGRDESGKFVKSTPAKQVTQAPPPPREASGRGAVPPDEVEGAAAAGDFTTFRNAANRRDLARRQGR